MTLAPGSLLAQLTTTATATLAYSATFHTEITRIVCASSVNDRFSIWHADSGQTAAPANALFLGNIISGGVTLQPILASHDGCGISVSAGGRIYCGSSATDAVTFSIYGITRAGR